MSGAWQRLGSVQQYSNDFGLKIREDDVIQPDGVKSIYGVVELKLGVSVLPVQGGKIWMVRHHRYIFDDEKWEFVTGSIEEGESGEQSARRELSEELGLSAGTLESVGSFRVSPGSTTERAEVFLASMLSPVESWNSEAEWDIKDRKMFALQEIEEMIEAGEVADGYSYSALYLYQRYVNKQNS